VAENGHWGVVIFVAENGHWIMTGFVTEIGREMGEQVSTATHY
jgi:hypothetical protein